VKQVVPRHDGSGIPVITLCESFSRDMNFSAL
jgi:hypothetical protein